MEEYLVSLQLLLPDDKTEAFSCREPIVFRVIHTDRDEISLFRREKELSINTNTMSDTQEADELARKAEEEKQIADKAAAEAHQAAEAAHHEVAK